MSRLRETGSVLSRLLHVLAFGGRADWSTSARAYRDRHDPKWRRRMMWIDRLLGEAHCERWYFEEIARSRSNVKLHESDRAQRAAASQRAGLG